MRIESKDGKDKLSLTKKEHASLDNAAEVLKSLAKHAQAFPEVSGPAADALAGMTALAFGLAGKPQTEENDPEPKV